MENLIIFNEYPIKDVLDILLQDKTTGKNIIWATDSYLDKGKEYSDRYEIRKESIVGKNSILIQPRAFKGKEDQQARTKIKAEVFTPSWIVNKMNNILDEEWFGNKDNFNSEINQNWKLNENSLPFHSGKSLTQYIDRTILEVACGEAPFIISRYDVITGKPIPIKERVGMLDRKLRSISENIHDEKKWIKSTKKAFKRVYGYEYQGDNLLIARANLFLTFIEYYENKFGKKPEFILLKNIAEIISYNFWQMDGLTHTVPLGSPKPINEQLSLFETEEKLAPRCTIKDWKNKKVIIFDKLLTSQIETIPGNDRRENFMAKFDVIIGNPPYQIEAPGTSTSDKPVYHFFMQESYKMAQTVEFITPARFLFNAGATPKKWNESMLKDSHLHIVDFNHKSMDVFPNTDIKGGVVITYWDHNKTFNPIEVFTPFSELNSIIHKVWKNQNQSSLIDIIYNQNKFNLDLLYQNFSQEELNIGSNGRDKRLRNNTFEKVPVFTKKRNSIDDIEIIGVIKNKRCTRFISRKYLEDHENLNFWKILIPRANGSGSLGEVLSTPLIGTPLIGTPLIGYTQSFIGVGAFSTENEAQSALKYIKSKFLRTMLGVLKVTQDNPPEKWKYVPIQDFTSNSDIDWSKSISEIDQQLYQKYGLSSQEIEFIEIHVKEME